MVSNKASHFTARGEEVHTSTWAGIILAQNDDGPLKWANGPYPIQIHANVQILKDHFVTCQA